MARTKEQKKEIVNKLKTIMDNSQSMVFVNIHGLHVANATEMRKRLKKDGVGFFVAKKTLTDIALKGKKYEGSQPSLTGEIGLAYGTDLITPARDVFEFQNKFKNNVNIVGGIFEKRYMTKEEMIDIASIPPLSTLYGMFVNIINSPIQGLVMALDQIASKKTV